MAAPFVLLHSPLVGPTTWRLVAEELVSRSVRVAMPSLLGVQSAPVPYWPTVVEIAAGALEALHSPAVVVAHSGAGPILPAVSALVPDRIKAYLFVDASLPALGGRPRPDDSAFLEQLAGMADEGMLPPWSRWFGEGVMERLVPDAALRLEVEAELPRLRLDYFDEQAPVPAGWPDAPCAYLQFSNVYDDVAADAAQRGWLVQRLPGRHLHMLVEPKAVADRLLEMADAITALE